MTRIKWRKKGIRVQNVLLVLRHGQTGVLGPQALWCISCSRWTGLCLVPVPSLLSAWWPGPSTGLQSHMELWRSCRCTERTENKAKKPPSVSGCSFITWICFCLQVVGHKKGLYVMERADPLFLLMGLPTIPMLLVLGKMIRWEDYLVRLWQKYSYKRTPGICTHMTCSLLLLFVYFCTYFYLNKTLLWYLVRSHMYDCSDKVKEVHLFVSG